MLTRSAALSFMVLIMSTGNAIADAVSQQLDSALGEPSAPHSRDCLDGSPAVLTVVSWSAEVYRPSFGRDGVSLTMTIENRLDHDIRMVEGRVFFDDVLGRGIVNVSIHDDARISAGGTYEQSGRYQSYGSSDITRIALAEQVDIAVTACVEGVVTASGEVIRYR